MGSTVLGIVLIVIGVIAILAGIGGGVAKMFLDLKEQSRAAGFGALDLPVKTMEALTSFLNALVKAPIWLALVIIGLLLVVFGGTMI